MSQKGAVAESGTQSEMGVVGTLSSSTSPSSRPIVVYAPTFNENSGGIVVLHALVDRLRARGVDAYLHFYLDHDVLRLYRGVWSRVPELLRVRPLTWFLKGYRRLILRQSIRVRTPKTSGFLDTPIANKRILKEAVVLYPETVHGNPLRSSRVARWLLYLPGFHQEEVRFGKDEEMFYYKEQYKGEYDNLGPDRYLYVTLKRDDVYYNPQDAGAESGAGSGAESGAGSDSPPLERKGTCYMVRKGRKFGLDAALLAAEGKLVIDGKSHQEIGDIFRKCELLVSYDCNSMYHVFAIMCGCVPVLLKPPDMPQEMFENLARKRPGFAIGFEEVEQAKRTRAELLEMIRTSHLREEQSIESFLKVVNDAWPMDAGGISKGR